MSAPGTHTCPRPRVCEGQAGLPCDPGCCLPGLEWKPLRSVPTAAPCCESGWLLALDPGRCLSRSGVETLPQRPRSFSLSWACLAFSAAVPRERRLCVCVCVYVCGMGAGGSSGQEQRSALTPALADLHSPIV